MDVFKLNCTLQRTKIQRSTDLYTPFQLKQNIQHLKKEMKKQILRMSCWSLDLVYFGSGRTYSLVKNPRRTALQTDMPRQLIFRLVTRPLVHLWSYKFPVPDTRKLSSKLFRLIQESSTDFQLNVMCFRQYSQNPGQNPKNNYFVSRCILPLSEMLIEVRCTKAHMVCRSLGGQISTKRLNLDQIMTTALPSTAWVANINNSWLL